jgi:hypothetical protein
MRATLTIGLLVAMTCAGGCVEHRVQSDPIEVKPIRVEPIHITVDVNVRVQERLERFFAFEEELETPPAPPADQ